MQTALLDVTPMAPPIAMADVLRTTYTTAELSDATVSIFMIYYSPAYC